MGQKKKKKTPLYLCGALYLQNPFTLIIYLFVNILLSANPPSSSNKLDYTSDEKNGDQKKVLNPRPATWGRHWDLGQDPDTAELQ